MSSNASLGNPAVVGLAGFATSTLVLQFHNLGIVGIGAVIPLALFFGGLGQFIAGYNEFKAGNSFGYSAFVAYGSFWLAFVFLLMMNHFEIYPLSAKDIGMFLFGYFVYTFFMMIASLRLSKAMALTFITLDIGFFGLFLVNFFGMADLLPFVAYELILCAGIVYYMLLSILVSSTSNGKVNIPLGEPFIK